LITLFDTGTQERSKLPLILGYAIATAALVWVLHDFHIVQALRDLARVDYRWVVLGMTFDIMSYVMQSVRWKLLLSPFGKVRLTSSIRAVFAGLFANLVFPLRPGEFLRCYLLSDSEDLSIGRVGGALGVERLIDLVIATASLGVISLVVDLPRRFNKVADILGYVTLTLVTIVVVIILYLEIKMGSNPEAECKRKGMTGKVMAALTGLHAMGTAPSFYPAVFASLGLPGFQTLALWAMMRSYGLHPSMDGHSENTFLASIVVVLVINLGVSLPNAPANVGAYQFFCVLGLSVFQVEKTTATGFSIFAFLALTIPFIFLGFAAVVRSGLSLRSMKETVSHMPRNVAKGQGPAQAPSQA
jgi:glycosyltransferase 2 family protein